MLREWVLNLVFSILHIAGNKNYADLLTKPLPLEAYQRYRDAILSAQIVLPPGISSVSANYCSRLQSYLFHAVNLPDS